MLWYSSHVFFSLSFDSCTLGANVLRRYQNGKSNLDFTEARDSEWQWHQLDHMQICTLPETDIYASTQPLICWLTKVDLYNGLKMMIAVNDCQPIFNNRMFKSVIVLCILIFLCYVLTCLMFAVVF